MINKFIQKNHCVSIRSGGPSFRSVLESQLKHQKMTKIAIPIAKKTIVFLS